MYCLPSTWKDWEDKKADNEIWYRQHISAVFKVFKHETHEKGKICSKTYKLCLKIILLEIAFKFCRKTALQSIPPLR